MPNVKISQLPYNANPDTAALIPIVQSGTTWYTDFVQIIDVMLVGELAGVFQSIGNISQNVSLDGNSTTKYPSVKATKQYADGLVVGLLSDRGNYTPSLVSPGAYPSTGGRGPGGIPAKGDLWFIAANGFLGTTAVVAGQSVRALIDAPGQTVANWDILDVAGFTAPPETTNNKVISKAQFISNGSSTVRYPSIKAVKDYIDQEVTLQDVITNSRTLTNNNNLQGLNSGAAMGAVTNVNAFGESAAAANTGNSLNAIGLGAGNANSGDYCNVIGNNAGDSNSGDKINAIGETAGSSNSGDELNAIGTKAANANSGDFVVAVGYNSADGNSGNNLSAIGNNAGQSNAGIEVTAIGHNSSIGNSGNYVFAAGFNTGSNNIGQDLYAIGKNAAVNNSGNFVNGLGNNAAINNIGSNVNAFGNNAGSFNAYDDVTLLGKNAAADGPFQLVLSDGTKNLRFDASNIPFDTKLTIPTTNGTIVTSVNNTAPDPSGNVALPSVTPSLPYLMYAAILNPGALIGVTQLYNTIGDGSGNGITDISWSYNMGGFQASMSAGPFTTKAVVMPGGYFGLGTFFGITGLRVSSSAMIVYSWQANQPANQQQAYPFNVNIYVEIRIYP